MTLSIKFRWHLEENSTQLRINCNNTLSRIPPNYLYIPNLTTSIFFSRFRDPEASFFFPARAEPSWRFLSHSLSLPSCIGSVFLGGIERGGTKTLLLLLHPLLLWCGGLARLAHTNERREEREREREANGPIFSDLLTSLSTRGCCCCRRVLQYTGSSKIAFLTV